MYNHATYMKLVALTINVVLPKMPLGGLTCTKPSRGGCKRTSITSVEDLSYQCAELNAT